MRPPSLVHLREGYGGHLRVGLPTAAHGNLGTRERRWAHQDSNLERAGYEPAALTVELWARSIVTKKREDGRQKTEALRSFLEKRFELPAPRRVAELAQRFRFDLTDPLAGDGEALADFLERVLAAVSHAEPHLDHLLLARRQRLQDLIGLLLEVQIDHRVGR